MLKHREVVNETKYDPNSDYVDPKARLCVVPISKNEGDFPENIKGTGFLVNFNGLSYIVTVKHVIEELENPIIVFSDRKMKPFPIGTSVFQGFGINWIEHPDGEDLVVISLILPKSLDNKIENLHLTIKKSYHPHLIKPKIGIKHLGYGGKRTGHAKESKEGIAIPSSINGTFVSGNSDEILVRSPAEEGDSGGPLFVKESSKTAVLPLCAPSNSSLSYPTVPFIPPINSKPHVLPLSWENDKYNGAFGSINAFQLFRK